MIDDLSQYSHGGGKSKVGGMSSTDAYQSTWGSHLQHPCALTLGATHTHTHSPHYHYGLARENELLILT